MNLEITELYIPNGLWLEDGKWCGILEVNDSENTYEFSIKSGELKFEIDYKNSPYNEEVSRKVLEQALQNKKVQNLLEKTKEFAMFLDELTNQQENEMIKVNVENYTIHNNWELFDFYLSEYKVPMRYSVNGKEIFSFAQYRGEEKIRVFQVKTYIPTWMHEDIINQLRKDPKVRLKKIFKK